MGDMLHTLPSKLGLTRIWRQVHSSSVPVFLFHGVLPDADTSPFNSTGKFISPERLKAFLARISRLFRVVSVEEFLKCLIEGRRPSNMLVITFDDGYASNYTYALPLLREMGLPFSIFVTTGLVDTDTVLWTDLLEFAVFSTRAATLPKGSSGDALPITTAAEKRRAILTLKDGFKSLNLEEARAAVERLCDRLEVDLNSPELDKVRFLRSDQIREMALKGTGFGAHTVTHPILSRESSDRVRSEITESKLVLEAITGRKVTYFAYPNGRRQDFNTMVVRELKQAGYVASFTSIHGLHWPGDDLFEIKRISVDNRWTYEEFETRTSGILKALRR